MAGSAQISSRPLRVGYFPRVAGLGRVEMVSGRISAREEPEQSHLCGNRRTDVVRGDAGGDDG